MAAHPNILLLHYEPTSAAVRCNQLRLDGIHSQCYLVRTGLHPKLADDKKRLVMLLNRF
jgi:hypothetical protein